MNKDETVQSKRDKSNIYDENAEFLYSFTQSRLLNQLQQIDSLDNKVIGLLVSSCTLVAILTGVLSVIGITTEEIVISYILIIVSLILFIYIIITSIFAYNTKVWRIGAKLEEAWKYSRQFENYKMQRWAAKSFTQAYFRNIRHGINEKEKTVKVNIWILIVQLIISIFSIILVYVY